MRIESLELIGFTRMPLSNIRRFVITPTERIQLILGTNGSGKSSLVDQLTPLPASRDDFSKEGGSKTILITHRGSRYKLVSRFVPGSKHSFEKDGKELNPGETGSVQKDLVRQEFGITQETHDLATNRERFHAMAPTRRREWFTRLSDTSYDYALVVFGKLKSKHRDIVGGLRTNKERLVKEMGKVISREEEDILRKEVHTLHERLSELQALRAPIRRPVAACESDHQQAIEDLNRLSSQLLRMRGVMLESGKFESKEHLDLLIDDDRHEVTRLEALINSAVADHTKLSEQVAILKRTGAEGVASLQAKIHTARDQQQEILRRRKLQLEGFDPALASAALESVFEMLQATFAIIPQNDENQFSSLASQEDAKLLQALGQKLMDQQVELNKLNAAKAHMEAHKSNGAHDCPKCGHRWINGYSDEKYADLQKVIHTQIAGMETTKLETVVVEKRIQEFNEYRTLYMDYLRCTKNWPALQPFWDYLNEGQTVKNSPRAALHALETLRTDLQFEHQAQEIERQIQGYRELIAQAEKLGDANLTDSQTKLDHLTVVVEDLTYKLSMTKRRLHEHLQYRKQLEEFWQIHAKILETREAATQFANEAIEMMRLTAIQDCIRTLQTSLALKTEALNAVSLQKGLIAQLERNIAEDIVREEAAQRLVKELSPTDGLIAEGLLGFIRNFTRQMNDLIQKIWAYPLQVKDCGIAKEGIAELDYKFPMVVGNASNVVPDIKFGSSGMREIVDLSFQVVAAKYLGLGDCPLFLDEFGASLDEEHRHAATMTIKTLMDTLQFSQLYMVSHYESGYGSFTNAEACVIDARNITVPSVYNRHVEMS